MATTYEPKDTAMPAEAAYTAEAILRDNKYLKYIDLLMTLLDDKKTYTLSEVDRLLTAELKKEV